MQRLVASLPDPRPLDAYRQILLAYDGSDGARVALARVAAIATANSTVAVITVIPFESIVAGPDPIKQEPREWQWRALTEATALLERRGIHPFIEAAAGNPAAVITEVARTLNADVVVLGRGHDHRWHTAMKKRSIRRPVLQQLACDALVVAAP